MLEICFIRHGESVGNLENRFRGKHDFPLNENGMRQAQALKQELQEVPFLKIYSSPLRRAFDTAQIIANGKTVVETDEAFINISLGEWENRPKAEIQEKYPDLWKLWINNPEKLVFPGMETLAEVQQRSYGELLQLVEQHKVGKIAIVSHRAVLKPLFAAILGIPEPYFWKIHMDTAAYSMVEYRSERGFTLTCMNQNKHLGKYIREELG